MSPPVPGSASKRNKFSGSSYEAFLWIVGFALFVNFAVIYHAEIPAITGNKASLRFADHGQPKPSRPLFAICLLTKDDLGILPEWIAYHYHAVELRHLVVAVDPSSQSDPQPLFDTFRQALPDLKIDQWDDNKFMPEFFLNGTYDQVPNFMGVELHDKETFGEWHTSHKVGRVKVRDMTKVNNHRYRQTRLISQCSRHLAQSHASPKQVLLSLLDSDEYLVVNPWMVRDEYDNTPHISRQQQPPVSSKPSWKRLQSGSVLQYLVDSFHTTTSAAEASPCIQVPRLLFGSVETNATDDVTAGLVTKKKAVVVPSILPAQISNDTTADDNEDDVQLRSNIPRSLSRMETLRWKYHAAWNDTRNFQQKVLLELHRFPLEDELWGDHVNSVHRPSRRLCPPESDQGEAFATSAVAAFHYLGSVERYFARPHDLRRNRKRYRERSNLTFAREPGWIDQWLEEFVDTVGMDTAVRLLEPYIIPSST